MIKFLHGSWAYMLVLMYFVTLIVYIRAIINNKVFNFTREFRLAGFTLIVFSIQVLLGIITWFASNYFEGVRHGQMGVYMKNATDRLLFLEHPVMMFAAWLLTYYGYKRMKNAVSSQKKYMAVILSYGLAFLLILIRIPWHHWPVK